MLTRTKTFAFALTALTTLALAPATAEAQHGHKSYKYTGTCYHFDGEAHMIRALEILELTYWEQNDFVRRDLIDLACQEIRAARFEVRSGSARHYLQLANTYIHYFKTTCSPLYLDRAAAYIHYALKYEQRVCVPQIHHSNPWLHGGVPVHQGGHHGGHHVNKPQVSFSSGGIQFGGRLGGLRINW